MSSQDAQFARRVLTSLKLSAILGGIGLMVTCEGRLRDGFKWQWKLDGWLLVAIAFLFVVCLFVPTSPDTRKPDAGKRAEWHARKKPRKVRR